MSGMTTQKLYGGRVQRRDWSPASLTEEQARTIFQMRRFPDGMRCPFCEVDRHYQTKRGVYRCSHSECRRDFSLMTGTIMHGSKFKEPFRIWLCAEQLTQAGACYRELMRALKIGSGSAWELWHKLNNNGRRLL